MKHEEHFTRLTRDVPEEAPLDKAHFNVLAKRCDECLFTENKIVSPERADALTQEALANDGFFVCHKATLCGIVVGCHGFFDQHNTPPTAIAKAFGFVRFIKEERLKAIAGRTRWKSNLINPQEGDEHE